MPATALMRPEAARNLRWVCNGFVATFKRTFIFALPGFHAWILGWIRGFSFDASSSRPSHPSRGQPETAHRAVSGHRRPQRATANLLCNEIRLRAAEQNPGADHPDQ